MPRFRERRRAPRISFHTPVPARVRGHLEVQVLDLSLRDARIEHLGYLRPGSPFILELPPTISPIVLSARIVRSVVADALEGPTGEQVLRYQTGIEFLDLSADESAILARILERLAAEGRSAA